MSLRVVIVMRAAKSRLPRFLTGSFTIHGLLLGAIVIIPATRHHVTPIEDTMVVALAGPIGGPPAASSAAPPAAKPAAARAPVPPPPPKEAHTVHEIPLAKPKDKQVKPKAPPAKEPEPETPPTPAPAPSSKGTSTGAASPVPGTGTAPAPGTGAVTATIGGGDSSLGWYGAAVKAALEAAWIKPYLEDAEGTASVVVAFDIARDGTTRNLRVAQSSGIPSLDRSAQRAVIEASPLPGIPPTWTEATLPVTMRFDLTPENR